MKTLFRELRNVHSDYREHKLRRAVQAAIEAVPGELRMLPEYHYGLDCFKCREYVEAVGNLAELVCATEHCMTDRFWKETHRAARLLAEQGYMDFFGPFPGRKLKTLINRVKAGGAVLQG